MMEYGGADHGIERALHVAVLEPLLQKQHPIHRKLPPPGLRKQIGGDIHRQESCSLSDEHGREKARPAPDFQRVHPWSQARAIGNDFRPSPRPPLAGRRLPSPDTLRVVARNLAPVLSRLAVVSVLYVISSFSDRSSFVVYVNFSRRQRPPSSAAASHGASGGYWSSHRFDPDSDGNFAYFQIQPDGAEE